MSDPLIRAQIVAQGGRELAPGVYAVGDELHVDLEELIEASGGDPSSPADQLTAVERISQLCRDQGIEFGIDEMDRRN